MPSGLSVATMMRRLEKIENRKPNADLFPSTDHVELRGNNLAIQTDTDKQVLIVGAAGTGKTTACLKKIYDECMAHPYIRVALVRKTRASLIETTLVTFENKILGYGHPLLSGSSRQNRLSYVFPNNSRINIVGMDKPDRIFSSDYDFIYVCQAEELLEDDADALFSRLRNYKLPYQQLLMDCNPQSESHWLFQRQLKGNLKMLNSYHKDNPFYWKDGDWTPEGADYLKTLGDLSGVRYKRLFKGLWVSAEGAVYPFERNKHIYNQPLPPMQRYVAGVDWGHKDAGAMVLVGQGLDGRLYVMEEILRTGQTLDFWKANAHRWLDTYGYVQFMCDPSVPAHIQAFMLDGIPAVKAVNNIKFGVDLVQQRISTDRLMIYSGSVKQVDPMLREQRKPVNLTEEIEGYVWNATRDMPVDKDNHTLDALRYAVVHFDRPLSRTIPATTTTRKQMAQQMRRGIRAQPRGYMTTNR